MYLVRQSMQAAEQGSVNASRRRRRQRGDDVNRRAARALRLVQLGEVSSARQALEGAEVAPGTLDTLNQLRDENRRPPVPRSPVPEDIVNARPDHPFSLDCEQFLLNLRSSKRGAAAGPSGMTADHLMPLLETERDSAKLFALASSLAKGDVPVEVVSWVRMGRITALRKEDGGVRGITVGDILRRLVARTIAQQISKVVEESTAPYQYALSTKVGCECVAHIVQTLTDSDESATVVSVDGIGAFDLISRNAMLEGLMGIDGGDAVLPFVRQFYGHPSAHIWKVDMGNVHEIAQGEGGEQGDPLMPLLFSLGQHRSLDSISGRLRAGEKIMAYLDDVYVVCAPHRVRAVTQIVEEELFRHAHISVHHGKTQVWNRGGVEPSGIVELTRAAQSVNPTAVVWKSDPRLPLNERGLRVLGCPIGSPEFVAARLNAKSEEQRSLFQRIPLVADLQAAWVLLFYCGATRANFWLRNVQPAQTFWYAQQHDDNVWDCFSRLTGFSHESPEARLTSSVPLGKGGLGLLSAVRIREAAHWASWADILPMVHRRHPEVARMMVGGLARGAASCFTAVRGCVQSLVDVGFEPPEWESLLVDARPQFEEEEDPTQPKIGWQKKGVSQVEQHHLQTVVWPTLSEPERALWRSHSGPLASVVFVALPTTRTTRIEPQLFRVLLSRRLRLPLPFTSRSCRCGRLHDVFGHHRAACAEAGVLGRRGYALESAGAQVCREAGGRVSTNVMVRDLDVAEPRVDGRRLEIVVDGLPLFSGAQLAVDTTMVSPLHRDGTARRGAALSGEKVLEEARRRKERTYPELSGAGGRARLAALAATVGGRWSQETAQFLRGFALFKSEGTPELLRERVKLAWLRRWQNLLACGAAKAFALSLLERRLTVGAGCTPPPVDEVVREARYAW